MIEDNRSPRPKSPGEVNVEVRQVGDEHDIGDGEPPSLSPEPRPYLGDAKRQRRRAPRLPGRPDPAGGVERQWDVALGDLVT